MTVHMSETIQKDYGVNLNIKYHKDVTRAWDKCQEEVREQTRTRAAAAAIVTSHCSLKTNFENRCPTLNVARGEFDISF